MNNTSFSTSNADAENGVLIYWDGFGLQNPGSGIFEHIRELYNEFKDSSLKPRILIDASWRPNLIQYFNAADLVDVPGFRFSKVNKNKLFWNLRTAKFLKISVKKSEKKQIIYHAFSNYNLPYVMPRNTSCYLTLHDLIPYEFPNDVGLLYVWQFKYLLNRALKQKPQLIFVSDSTKKTFEKYFSKYSGPMRVIENGITKETSVPSKPLNMKNILVVGRDETYKRLNFALDVFSKLDTEYRMNIVTDYQGSIRIKKLLSNQKNIGERIAVHTDLSKETLYELYHSSSVYLHTSLSEGFGLPLIEALAHFRPIVVLPNIGISNKISSKIAILPNSKNDLNQWVSALESAEKLGEAAQFLEDCRSNLNEFATWKESAECISRLYESSIS